MKTKIYEGRIKTNKVGSECYFDFEMPEDATEEEIESEAFSAAMEKVEWSFVAVETDKS